MLLWSATILSSNASLPCTILSILVLVFIDVKRQDFFTYILKYSKAVASLNAMLRNFVDPHKGDPVDGISKLVTQRGIEGRTPQKVAY